ncbi:KAP P-loop domain [Branchiostoma belcheri]|nr:KAP P-loop domain [Branchiostoma belcheri]
MDVVNGSADSVFDEADLAVPTIGTVELIARQDDYRGTLEVTVVRARLNKDAVRRVRGKSTRTTLRTRTQASVRSHGSCDPYVTVELGEDIFTTKVARQTYTPMFNDTFRFQLRKTSYASVLHVNVRNFRTFKKDKLIGAVTLHVGELDLGTVQQFDLKVANRCHVILRILAQSSTSAERTAPARIPNPGPLGSESSTLPLRHTTPLVPVSRPNADVVPPEAPRTDISAGGTRTQSKDDIPQDADPNTNRTEETDSLVSAMRSTTCLLMPPPSVSRPNADVVPPEVSSKAKDLHTAALRGDIGRINKFLEAGHDVNEMKSMRLFPHNTSDVVKEHQFEDVTPLHCAVVAGNAKIVSRLLRAGADTLVRSKREAYVRRAGQSSCGPDHDQTGYQAIMEAWFGGPKRSQRRRDSAELTADLQSPLHMATWFGHGEILELLLLKYEVQYQQQMKQQGVNGPLTTTTARLLSWVDPTIRKDLKSMIWEAARVDNVAFLNVLVGQLQWTVEDLTIRDRQGNTPLHIAVHHRYQSKKFAQALLGMNSDLLGVKNDAGQTVENVAADDMKFTLMGAAKRVGSLKSDSHFEEDSLGYWVYAKTVADILTDESTTMPITVGIYARWGTGKSFILNQVKHEIDENIAKATKLREMERYNSKITTKRKRSIPVPPLPFSSCVSVLAFLFFAATVVGGVLSYLYYRAIYKIILIVGIISTHCTLVIVAYLKRKDLKRILLKLFPGLRWTSRHLQLVGIWLDLLDPPNLETNLPNPGHVKIIHVQFNAWEYSGCSALWAGIVTKLCDEVEGEIGPWTTRLYRAIHDKFTSSERPPVTGRLWFKPLFNKVEVEGRGHG